MRAARLGVDEGPWDRPRRWLVLAPHPDDFDVVAVTMRRLKERGCELFVEVLTGGASGVEDEFANGWEGKTAAREEEQRESCRRFGLAPNRLRFHRFEEDETGAMRDEPFNATRIADLLHEIGPDAVVLPHGRDSNADHRRAFRFFDAWRRRQPPGPPALLVRDPKTLDMRIDLITPFCESEADWKGELLRCHRSQHERNLRQRGIGFDERILQVNREIGAEHGEPFAEGFEWDTGR
jgi:LmbE family N-acetylglucosaminyl deacetylase